jgi:hypothetical protein
MAVAVENLYSLSDEGYSLSLRPAAARIRSAISLG